MEAMLAQFEIDAGNIKVEENGGGNGGNQQQQDNGNSGTTRQGRNNKGVHLSDYTEEELLEAYRQGFGYYDQQP